jgi:hypothetical protein
MRFLELQTELGISAQYPLKDRPVSVEGSSTAGTTGMGRDDLTDIGQGDFVHGLLTNLHMMVCTGSLNTNSSIVTRIF